MGGVGLGLKRALKYSNLHDTVLKDRYNVLTEEFSSKERES